MAWLSCGKGHSDASSPSRRCALRAASASLASRSSSAYCRPVALGGLEGGLVGGESSIARVCAAAGLPQGLLAVVDPVCGDTATAAAAGSAGASASAAIDVSGIGESSRRAVTVLCLVCL